MMTVMMGVGFIVITVALIVISVVVNIITTTISVAASSGLVMVVFVTVIIIRFFMTRHRFSLHFLHALALLKAEVVAEILDGLLSIGAAVVLSHFGW